MRERCYQFTLDDGSCAYLTIDQALERNDTNITHRLKEIRANLANKRRCRDGFVAGYQENLGEYVGGRLEYDKKLKEKGLVELGYSAVPRETTSVSNHCANLDFALHAREQGVELSDNEVEAIASGEYFSADKCDLTSDPE